MKKGSNAEHRSPVGATLVATAHESRAFRRAQGPELFERASTLPQEGSLSLWLWVAAGFLFLGLLWTGMIIAIRHVDNRTVPLATQEAKP